MRFRRCFFFCSLVIGGLFLIEPSAQAGAWLAPRQGGIAIVTSSLAQSRKIYDARGRAVPSPSYRTGGAQLYLEYGVTDSLTLVGEANYMDFVGAADPAVNIYAAVEAARARLPVLQRPAQGPAYAGLGLGAGGVRFPLARGADYVVSFQASARGASPAARRFLDMRAPAQLDARVLHGRAFRFAGLDGFFDAQIGLRTGGQNGVEARLDLTAGLWIAPALMAMVQSFSAFTPRGGTAGSVGMQRFQASAVYEMTPRIAVQIGASGVLAGVNAPSERGGFAALWWRY
jgi:hypothetical protein